MKSTSMAPVDSAVEALGDRWTPQLLRQFANHGTLRFCGMQDAVGGINPRTLSMRLTALEEQGIVEKVPTSTSRCEYRLTTKGRDLLSVVASMAQWSAKYDTEPQIA